MVKKFKNKHKKAQGRKILRKNQEYGSGSQVNSSYDPSNIFPMNTINLLHPHGRGLWIILTDLSIESIEASRIREHKGQIPSSPIEFVENRDSSKYQELLLYHQQKSQKVRVYADPVKLSSLKSRVEHYNGHEEVKTE